MSLQLKNKIVNQGLPVYNFERRHSGKLSRRGAVNLFVARRRELTNSCRRGPIAQPVRAPAF